MGITLLTKEIKPKNIFYRNEVQYRDDVPTKKEGRKKEGRDVRLLSL